MLRSNYKSKGEFCNKLVLILCEYNIDARKMYKIKSTLQSDLIKVSLNKQHYYYYYYYYYVYHSVSPTDTFSSLYVSIPCQ